MLYRPKEERLWDTWVVPHQDAYYLFYIRKSRNETMWNGISLAVSHDMLHWKEVGPVIEKHPEAVWLGTGMVHKIGGRFVMNFSEERPAGTQVICFAESADLFEWIRVPEYSLRPDERYYLSDAADSCELYPRWDSLGVVNALADAPPPYIAFLTAHAKDRPLKGDCGTLGMVKSEDGMRWECLPPAAPAGLFPVYEVPEYVRFDERYYVLFSCVTQHGTRYDRRSIAKSGGTYYVVSDDLYGPYRLPPGDPLLIGVRDHPNVLMAYLGRPLLAEDGYLFYHLFGNDRFEGWVGMPKRLVEREPYVLELRYWEGVERLKGRLLDQRFEPSNIVSVRTTGKLPSVMWTAQSDALAFANQGSQGAVLWQSADTGILSLKDESDLSDGRIVECTVRIDEGIGAGVWFGRQRHCIFFNVRDGRIEIGNVGDGWAVPSVFDYETSVLWRAMRAEQPMRVRIFGRSMFMELYVDDVHVVSYRQPHSIDWTRFGFYSEASSGAFGEWSMWEMA